jgi:hypothetical protein
MAFVPEGQADSSQARSVSEVWIFGEGHSGVPRRWLQGSAQGFNPGNPQNNELTLKGREADLIKLAAPYCCAKN